MANLVTLPFELRARIFHYYFKVDGGYVFNGDSEKLTTADNNPIDLALIYTCRSVANETRNMPLTINTITFSTLYREDWRGLAGCFNAVSTYHRLLEADLVVRLARFMTPDMYSQLALKFPTLAPQIQKESRHHENCLAHYETGRWPSDSESESDSDSDSDSDYESEGNLDDIFGPDSDSEKEKTNPSDGCYEWRHGRSTQSYRFWYEKHLQLGGSENFYRSLGSIDHDKIGHLLRHDWEGGSWAIQAAMSYCLRLLAEKERAEFARLVYGALPGWVDTYPAHELLDLRFEPWAIPSLSEVARATSRFKADVAWKLLEPWYYTPPMAYNPPGVYDRLHPPTGVRCREKIRFSAAATAIRFLQRLPASQRLQIRNLVLHEDHRSVGTPSTHAQGLAPFFKENPRLRVVRRVSVLGCIEGSLGNPQKAAQRLQEQKDGRSNPARVFDLLRFPWRLAEWLVDALAVTDVGIPAESFTFILEAGPHADFCTDIFQQAIHRDIAWDRAYKACINRGLIVCRPSQRLRRVVDQGLEEAMEHLLNQTSFLRSDFNPGHPWNFENLVEETSHLDNLRWTNKWAFRQPWNLDFPPTLDIAKSYSDNFEIQTEDDYL
ncbi:uncharacterized protein NECHADRAFT_85259 [Fusarium vanettenii 77-13-4]|uniref:Uncharacterized protein n=1 Tax=Fusarium vanettenii (strain ATCC MYA-4622 / CBS 123669 / FGSC 9596 / NRRL 45880 / 77-13-4) TaxID=660122 RepID=C7YVF6_FUSV7|nr:uncharacterized protein NECHADRAFT_85259 [Fusarium vanettenii 77-13-4]EEU44580.1 hypothetical protein NECHADRAFT_85259 [Fusarium vanettenii 77-13-4]